MTGCVQMRSETPYRLQVIFYPETMERADRLKELLEASSLNEVVRHAVIAYDLATEAGEAPWQAPDARSRLTAKAQLHLSRKMSDRISKVMTRTGAESRAAAVRSALWFYENRLTGGEGKVV